MRNAWWLIVCGVWACGDSSNESKSDAERPEIVDTSEPLEVEDTVEPPEEVTPTSCTIDGATIPDGAIDATNACRFCDLASPTAWTIAPDGAECGTGRCTAGQCLQPPRVDSVTPRCADNRGGDTVTVSGAHFSAGASAILGAQSALLLTFGDPETLTLTVAEAPGVRGEVPLTITNPDGQSASSPTPFLYFDGLAFESPRTNTLDAIPLRFAAGDVDGDGRDDLVLPTSATLYVARQGESTGLFGDTSSLPGCAPQAVAVFDATGDTLADVVAVCADGLKVYAGSVGGLPTLVAGTSPTLAPTRQLAAGRFNDDAFTDLAVIFNTTNEVQILLGRVDGAFTPFATLAQDTNAAWLDAGDLNGDGLDDLVTAHTGADNIQVFLASPTGMFAQPKTLVVASPGTVQLVRLDADTLEDLVVSAQDSDVSASWFRSLGDGTFAERVNFTSGALIGAAVGDLNEDGFGDAVVNSGPGIRVFPSHGASTFVCSSTIEVASPPQYLILGDFDGNGRLDIAGRNSSLAVIYMFMQREP